MTQKEKALLFKDLCARLPYQPICEFTDTEDDFCTATASLGYSLRDFIAGKVLIKPYLRPMSSMTEEEKKEFIHCAEYEVEESVNGRHYEYYLKDYVGTPEKPICNYNAIDWLNKYHFDYRGLIEKGLALEATKNMYQS